MKVKSPDNRSKEFGKLKLLKYSRGITGEYNLYLGNQFYCTVDNYQEAVQEDEQLLTI